MVVLHKEPSMSRDSLIQFRKGTLSQFNSANPTLASGEPGICC